MSVDEEKPFVEDEAGEEDPNAARFRVVMLAVLVEGGLVLLALVIGWLFETHPLSRLKLDLAGVVSRRKHDDWYLGGRGIRLEFLKHGNPVHLGHVDVQ